MQAVLVTYVYEYFPLEQNSVGRICQTATAHLIITVEMIMCQPIHGQY